MQQSSCIPVHDTYTSASHSTLPVPSRNRWVRVASRIGWAPLRLEARHCSHLALSHESSTITIILTRINHVLRVCAGTRFSPCHMASTVSSSRDYQGFHFGVFLLLEGFLLEEDDEPPLPSFCFSEWSSPRELAFQGFRVISTRAIYP